MADKMTPLQRHHCMSSIPSRSTKPEMVVRRWLWRHGFRYRVNVKSMPGSPDIVLRRYSTVIFINGCFWHGHDCEKFKWPQTNVEFWRTKIERNRNRDLKNYQLLHDMGYYVLVVWECQLSPKHRNVTLRSLEQRLSQILLDLHKPSRPYMDIDTETALAAES